MIFSSKIFFISDTSLSFYNEYYIFFMFNINEYNKNILVIRITIDSF